MRQLTLLLIILLLLSCNDIEEIPYDGPPIEFAIIGDYGDAKGKVAEVADLVKSWNPHFILTLGDNNYEDGEHATLKANISDHYCDYIYNPDAPDSLKCDGLATHNKLNAFFPSLGNHDYDSPLEEQAYLDFFTLPNDELNYDFVKGPIHFFVLNSCVDTLGNPYSDDIEDWLKEKTSSSTSPFKVCYLHHPPYSFSKHGSHDRVQFDYSDMGIDLVLAGHNHVYERLTPLDNDRLHYIINGLGGREFIDLCDDLTVDTDQFARICYNNDHGAMFAWANGDSLVLKFHSLSLAEVVDEVIIFN